jgi:hypothetical protein
MIFKAPAVHLEVKYAQKSKTHREAVQVPLRLLSSCPHRKTAFDRLRLFNALLADHVTHCKFNTVFPGGKTGTRPITFEITFSARPFLTLYHRIGLPVDTNQTPQPALSPVTLILRLVMVKSLP